ncbi:MAG TPA: flagellar basal-body MS-ring/collar protein FliF [Actinomycetales bacterium]|nr:flagellar basal-body MS-ring/collar protein FliF [Actinomycetales bacterium]
MQKQLLGSLKRASGTFGQFSTPQKLIAGIGVAVLVLGGFAFTRWASAPTLAPLFTNLASSDASAIVDQLDSEGVPYELGDGGQSILVPRQDVYRLRLKMSSSGLPASSDTGYALLDQQGVTASQFQQQVTWQRALEGELARTIGSISGVKAAVVHLAIPAKDVFLDEEKDPTASVLVQTRPGAELPGQQVQSIIHLVASSVEGLSPDDVTVVDGEGALLSAAGQGGAAAGGMRDQQTIDYESRVTTAVQTVLDRVLGKGNAVATVTADLDFDSTNRTTESFTAEDGVPPLSATKTTEKYTGGGAAVGGVLGPDNIQVPAGAAGGQDSTYTKESSTSNNAVNKVTEHTVEAPGALRRQSVAVVVDAGAAGTVDMTQLRETVSAAAGIQADRGDSISVSRMAFDTTAADAATKALQEAQKTAEAQRKTELLRTGGIVLAVLALALVAFLASRRRRRQDRQPHDIGELQVVQHDMAQAALESADSDETAEQAPALPPGPGPDADLLAMRDEVTELVERQPDEVAELLRGWLADRRA